MGFYKLPKVEQMVAHELMNNPKTRDSDELLTVYVYRDFYGIGNEPFSEVMLMRSTLGIPSQETIGRCRRKLQEKLPLVYGSTAKTKRNRMRSEHEFKEYSRR